MFHPIKDQSQTSDGTNSSMAVQSKSSKKDQSDDFPKEPSTNRKTHMTLENNDLDKSKQNTSVELQLIQAKLNTECSKWIKKTDSSLEQLKSLKKYLSDMTFPPDIYQYQRHVYRKEPSKYDLHSIFEKYDSFLDYRKFDVEVSRFKMDQNVFEKTVNEHEKMLSEEFFQDFEPFFCI